MSWRPGWEEHRDPFQPQSLRFQLGHQRRAGPLKIQQRAGTSEGAGVRPNPAPPHWASPQGGLPSGRLRPPTPDGRLLLTCPP